jgi:hypothetical protein
LTGLARNAKAIRKRLLTVELWLSAIYAGYNGALTYFTDELADLRSKEAALQTRGVWIIELSALDSLSHSEVARIKGVHESDHGPLPTAVWHEAGRVAKIVRLRRHGQSHDVSSGRNWRAPVLANHLWPNRS